MKTVGKQLQDARMAKGWSPEMAARETKIRLDRLRELEEDDYSNFSSPTYARGFVRTYARALGLDEYRVLRQLDNKLPEDDNATFINDTGVPYMPEPGQVSKPFEVGRGVYIAGGVGAAMLLLIGFILVQSYRAGYFATASPPPAALPVTATNALPAVPDTETARALPADSNAAPVPVPVDLPPTAVATAPPAAATAVAAAPTDTNAAPRALPVDLNALAATTNAAPAATSTAPAVSSAATSPAAGPAATNLVAVPAAPAPAPVAVNPPAANAPAANAPAANVAAEPTTVPITTATPPRALPVDLNALGAADGTNAPAAAIPSTNVVTAVPPPAPAPETAPEQPTPRSLSARDSDTGPGDVHLAAAEKATQDLIAATTPPAAATPPVATPAAAPVASPVVLPSQPAPAGDPAAAPAPVSNQPVADSAETGSSSSAAPAAPPAPGDTFHGKRLVLTASHDSFVRVIALDGPNAGQVRYSSMLHSGQSISFDDRKYSINVGDPSAVDIALDGINYGPHSDDSTPDTFTVESHIP